MISSSRRRPPTVVVEDKEAEVLPVAPAEAGEATSKLQQEAVEQPVVQPEVHSVVPAEELSVVLAEEEEEDLSVVLLEDLSVELPEGLSVVPQEEPANPEAVEDSEEL